MRKKRVHIIGIAGQLSAPLARGLKELGWEVSGSDQEKAYPPVTDYLARWGIKWSRGFSPDNLPEKLDLVIVAGCALLKEKENPELTAARQRGVEVISQAEAINRWVIKDNSIVVAGTYGKTTTTAFLAQILKQGGKNPSFMFGGIPRDFSHPLEITSSSWSVVEGDEYPTLNFDSRPKFLLYQPRFLLLTAVLWEHVDVYPTREEYYLAFRKLVDLVPPKKGLILAGKGKPGIERVIQDFSGKKIFYSLRRKKGADWWGEGFVFHPDGVRFFLRGRRLSSPLLLKTRLLGEANAEDALAAAAMALELGVEKEAVQKGVASFGGIKKRLEIKGNYGGRVLVADVSQTKPRIKGALRAIRNHFPGRIWVVFFPHYSGLLFKKGLKEFSQSFSLAEGVIITRVYFRRDIKKEERVTGPMIKEAIYPYPKKVWYLPRDEEVVAQLKKETRPGDVIVFMSSGGYRGMIKKLKVSFQKGRKDDQTNC